MAFLDLGMGGHQSGSADVSTEWCTPRYIIEDLGPFHLDPCSPAERPWDTARIHLTRADDGLIAPWEGRVWLNPPYGPETGKWMKRLAEHGNGIALIFARTETRMFFAYVWRRASAILFIRGRIDFYRSDGSKLGNAGAPSVLVAYGRANVRRLRRSSIDGKFIELNVP